MDFSKKIKTLWGEDLPKSGARKKEIDALPRLKDKEGNETDNPDLDKLEKETIGNVVLICLANYVSKDLRDGFYSNYIAQEIIKGKKNITLKDKLKKFLIDVLKKSIIMEVEEEDQSPERKGEKNVKKKKVVKGLYQGWVITQALEELGVKEEV